MIIAYDWTVVHEMLIYIIIIFLRSILKSFYQHLKNQTEQQVQVVRPYQTFFNLVNLLHVESIIRNLSIILEPIDYLIIEGVKFFLISFG